MHSESRLDLLRDQATERIWQLKGIDGNVKLVLLALARSIVRSTADGWVCSPSQVRIAAETCLSRRTVIRIMKQADSRFLDKRKPRRDGDTCSYVLLAKPRCQDGTPPRCQDGTPPRDKQTRTGCVRVSHDQENISPLQNGLSPKPLAAAEAPKAAAAAAVQSGDRISNGKPEAREPDAFIEGVVAVFTARPDLPPKLLGGAASFAATLRERGVSIPDLDDAIELTMARRRARAARDSISSLRYFLPAIDEITQPQSRGGHANERPGIERQERRVDDDRGDRSADPTETPGSTSTRRTSRGAYHYTPYLRDVWGRRVDPCDGSYFPGSGEMPVPEGEDHPTAD